jgi:hypothetical protein
LAGRKNFVAGEILTAADVNSFLMDQAVQVYDDAAARATALPSPLEGQVTYRKDTKQVEAFNGAAFAPIGRILQVVQATKTDTFSSTTAGYNAIPGLSVSITPSSTSSKVLIFTMINATDSVAAEANAHIRITGGNAGTFVGDSAGSRIRAASVYGRSSGAPAFESYGANSVIYLDSPNTTSSTTYQVEVYRNAGTVFVNRTATDTDSAFFGRGASSITVMEVAG